MQQKWNFSMTKTERKLKTLGTFHCTSVRDGAGRSQSARLHHSGTKKLGKKG